MRFHFKPILTIVTLISIGILLSLGVWQVQRLEWKNDLIVKVDSRLEADPVSLETALAEWQQGNDPEYTPVQVVGTFIHTREAHVFGIVDKQPGWFVMTPLDLTDTDEIIYVNRGFVSEAQKEAIMRSDGQIAGEVTVTGLFRAPQKAPAIAGAVAAPNNPEANQWYERNADKFAAVTGIDALPIILDSTETVSGGPKGGTTRVEFNNRHAEYALTWFGLAATLLAVYLAFTLKPRQT